MEDELYKEQILHLYRNPLNKKTLADFDVRHRELNPLCGDDIEVFIKFDDGGKIADIGYQGIGCVISQAGVSLITEKVKGKSKDDITNFPDEDMINLLGIPISHTRMKCATLGLMTIKDALNSAPPPTRGR